MQILISNVRKNLETKNNSFMCKFFSHKKLKLNYHQRWLNELRLQILQSIFTEFSLEMPGKMLLEILWSKEFKMNNSSNIEIPNIVDTRKS